MSSAGQANEAGSVFRRDAAVYFAVYALIGKPIAPLNQTARVQRLDFETTDPTDDIVLSLDDGTKAFISAKNHVDAGKSFKETVAGWIAQVEEGMGPNDLLGLTFGSCAGWVRDLADGLRRLRLGQEISRTAELSALQKLDALVPEGHRDEIRQRARYGAYLRIRDKRGYDGDVRGTTFWSYRGGYEAGNFRLVKHAPCVGRGRARN
ncbi:hypothetical protein [Propionicicella superfundia]|uniref:hypothetical protein n=1 Tax=Propionicicella superfundia TaxID=348582 RepID=UPI0012EC3C4F|nr:hypothetical protein [Propionicicella superfundia]